MNALQKSLPEDLKKIFPFRPNFFNGQHYIDEGEGDVILMLHGNPTWSFFYRHLIKKFTEKDSFRVVVPDHMGMGLSKSPQNYSYCLENHINNLEKLLDHLKITSFHLIAHDWGGAIGAGLALRFPERLKSLTLMNTAAFLSENIPARINILRTPFLGEWAIRKANLFAYPAIYMAPKKKLSPLAKKGLLFPYANSDERIAIARFVQDIPMSKTHKTYPILEKIEKDLNKLTCPKLLLWGEKDFCFDLTFLTKWQEIYPEAKTHRISEAGHYLLEDAPDECFQVISEFLNFKQ